MRKHSVLLAGHATSVSLEEPFWEVLQEIADRRGLALNRVVAEIDALRNEGNLSSELRLFVLDDLRRRLALAERRGSPPSPPVREETESG
jgi:predicted DNA-binding ribbon-helix-helix protein